MVELQKEELLQIKGGGVSVWGILGIGTLLVFLAGVVDGFARPLTCHS